MTVFPDVGAKTAIKWSLLLALSVFAQSYWGVGISRANLPCAHVLDANGSTVTAYCNGDSISIQSALDFAESYGHSKVGLDSGIFWVNQPMSVPFRWDDTPVGVFVPSGVDLVGSQVSPSIIKVSADLPQRVIVVTDETSSQTVELPALEAIVAAGGSKADREVRLTKLLISDIEIDGETNGILKTGIGLWVGWAKGDIRIERMHVHHTKRSGISLGYVSAEVCDSTNPQLEKAYEARGLINAFGRIQNNYLHHVNGSGIGVQFGANFDIAYNRIANGFPSGNSVGVGGFVGARNLSIHDNQVEQVHSGLAFDGSYPLCTLGFPRTRVGALAAQVARDEAGIGNELGFGQYISMRNNTIIGALEGISLWRQKYHQIIDNLVTGLPRQNGNDTVPRGLLLVESRDNYAIGNTIDNFEAGVWIYSAGYSLVGSTFNGIGTIPSGNIWVNKGNLISNSLVGMIMVEEGSFKRTPVASTVGPNAFRDNQVVNARDIYCSYRNPPPSGTIATGNIPGSCNLPPSP